MDELPDDVLQMIRDTLDLIRWDQELKESGAS